MRRKLEQFERRSYVRYTRNIHVESGAIFLEEGASMTQDKVINIGDNARIENSSIVVADVIENSFNTLAKADIDDGVKELVEQLLKQVQEAAKSAPADKAKDLVDDAKVLVEEVAREQPRRKWYALSIDGIREAAKALGEAGKPILDTAAILLPRLIALWP